MRRSVTYYILPATVLFSLLCFASCKKETENPPPPFYHYFPTDRGTYVIYNVDSIVHGDNDNNTDDSIYHYHFQLKDVVDTPFLDLEGRTRQVVVRYYRPDTSSAWVLRNVWSQSLTSTAAYRWENNYAFHKMAFPISSHQEWNENDMNTLGEVMYIYEKMHEQATFNDISFDSTVTTTQRDEDDNFVERNADEEVYANHVGLVFKQTDNLQKIVNVVVSGTEYTMVVAGYGRE